MEHLSSSIKKKVEVLLHNGTSPSKIVNRWCCLVFEHDNIIVCRCSFPSITLPVSTRKQRSTG